MGGVIHRLATVGKVRHEAAYQRAYAAMARPRSTSAEHASQLAQLVASRAGHQRAYAIVMAVCALVGVVLLAFGITRGTSYAFNAPTLVVLFCGLVATGVFSTLSVLGFLESNLEAVMKNAEKVVWIYERNLRSGSHHQLCICLADVSGVRWDVPVGRPLEQQPELLDELRERFPGARIGYSAERAAAYAKDPILVTQRRTPRSN